MTLFDMEPLVPLRKPTGIPESTLFVLAEVALKEGRYPQGVPAVGMAKDHQLDRMAAKGLLIRVTLDDAEVEEGPRRLWLTDAGRAALDAYDTWAEANGYTTMRAFVLRHVMGVAA